MRTIWVDLLCLESALQILRLSVRYPLEKVYFINVSDSFLPFISLLEKQIHKPVIQITTIVESQEKIDGRSIFETIYRKIEDLQNFWLRKDSVAEINQRFIDENHLNQSKYYVHLQEMSYGYLFRPVEISVLAAKYTQKDQSIYLLRKTPFQETIQEYLGSTKTFFYSTVISHYLSISNRVEYIRDAQLNGAYFKTHVFFVVKQLIYWLAALAIGLLSVFKRTNGNVQQANIGVELIQSRIRLDEINDLYWFKDSGIDPQTICGLEFEDYDDESISCLQKLGIRSYRVEQNPLKYLKRILFFWKHQRTKPLYVQLSYALRTIVWMGQLWYPLLFWNQRGWLLLQQTFYICRKEYWKGIYQRAGIQIVWSMYDLDEDKAAKAQAIEELNGFYMGSHWSNLVIFRTDGQKCYDVILTWGSHFIDLMLNRFPFLKIFLTGYPSDHYFIQYKRNAQELRNTHPNKFILSYQDSNMANDMANSKSAQIQIHQMLIKLLEKNVNLIIFLKPKREVVFKELRKDVSDLGKYLDSGRIKVYLGQSARTKAIPAEIGMASDLVVGLGISTAASECFFAGCIAFHADFTGFTSNQFVAKGLNTIIFDNVLDLQNAIQKRIDEKSGVSNKDYKKYYESLDPFQDGKAYLRSGFILRMFQEALRMQKHREDAVDYVEKMYNRFLEENKMKTECYVAHNN